MVYTVDFKEVATIGLESSPVAPALAGLRANEARYFWNKSKHRFTTVPASEAPETLAWIEKILLERELHFPYKPLEISSFTLDGMYTLAEEGKRAVGFKLSDGMAIPAEFEGKFKFARQKSKLAGTIRGSYFVIKGTY